jgi:hypothetical protein
VPSDAVASRLSDKTATNIEAGAPVESGTVEANMDSQAWELAAKIVAILAGVVIGSAAIGVACAVWARKQIFAYGGSALCMAGVVLLGLSIWPSIELAITATGVHLRAAQGIAGAFRAAGEAITVNDKSISVPKGPIQIGFWTPSAKTREAVDAKKWEIFEDDKKLDAFAERLMKAKIIEGYRRYEVVGEGRGARKVGAWWVSTNSADFKLTDFLRAYTEFWQPGEDSVYMEVLPLRSGGYSNAPR